MFKKKSKDEATTLNASDETIDETTVETAEPTNSRKWFRISVFANIVVLIGIVIFAASAFVINQSNTNPEFCASCHIMEKNVTSYLTSNNLDNSHAEAGVMCKDCHDYPLEAEIDAGIKYVTGNYVVDESGELFKRDFGDEICTQCHISLENVALSTDFLFYNPHGTVMGTFECSTCHVSHGEQIDYCSECHEDTGQRMIGDTTPRDEQIHKPVSKYSGMYGG